MVLAGNVLGSGKVGGYTEGCRVYNDTNIVTVHTVTKILTFNSERYDTDNIHSISSNSDKLVCKTAGIYIIMIGILWNIDSTGERQIMMYINNTFRIARTAMITTPNLYPGMNLSTVFALSVNDFLQARVWQDSGDDLDILSNSKSSPEFTMQRIG